MTLSEKYYYYIRLRNGCNRALSNQNTGKNYRQSRLECGCDGILSTIKWIRAIGSDGRVVNRVKGYKMGFTNMVTELHEWERGAQHQGMILDELS